MDPFFSIVMPVYNRAAFIETAIKSVLEQQFSNWELIIIDDGSTDNSAEIIQKYTGDPRIIYRYQTNQERSKARNNGIDMARGNFICFLDSDDYYLPNHLAVLKETIDSTGERPALYYTGYFVNSGGELKKNKDFSSLRKKGIYNILFEELLQTNSVCISARLLTENKFPENFNLFEDNHLWLRVIARSEMIYIPAATTVFCNHDARSLKVLPEKLKAKAQKYIDVLTDLFYSGKYPYLDEYITRKEKKTVMGAKMIVLTYEALNMGALTTAYSFLFRAWHFNFDTTRIIEYIKILIGAPFFVLLKNSGAQKA